jgi:hypothetical protein
MGPLRLLLASAALLAVIVTVAILDHEHKRSAMHRASKAAWMCRHKHQRCAADKPEAIEARWSRREEAYRGGFGAAALLGGVSLVWWRCSVSAKR